MIQAKNICRIAYRNMDKALIKNQFEKSLSTYDSQAETQLKVAHELAVLIFENMGYEINKVFEIGCGTGFLTKGLLKNFVIDHIVLNDISEGVKSYATALFESYTKPTMQFIVGDAEEITYPKNCNLITSSSAVQWFNNLPAFFLKADNALQQNGFIVLSTYGKSNFEEIKKLGFSSLNYLSVEEIKNIIPKQFKIIKCEEQIIKQYFSTPKEVLKHFKNTGVNGISRQKWTKNTLYEFTENYKNNFSEKESVYLTFNPIYLVLQKTKYS